MHRIRLGGISTLLSVHISYCYQAVLGVSGGAMFSAQSVERGKGINEGLKREELIPLRSRVKTAVVVVRVTN